MNIGFGNLKKEKIPLEKCKSLDGKIFYFEDEIPEKPHPNCKCEVVKVVSEEKYEKCDCKELLNKTQNAVENIIAETKTYLGTIQEINTDCEINKESLRDLLNKAYVIKDEYENELAKHLKTCANNKDEEYKEITQKIIDFEKLKKENETNSAKIYELNKNFQNFDKETRVHLVDIQQLKDYSADTPHKKDECKILEDVLDLQTKTKLVNSQFQDYKKQLLEIRTKKQNIIKAINSNIRLKNLKDYKFKKLLSSISLTPDEQICRFGSYGVDKYMHEQLKLANTSLQNAIDDFKYTKNTPNVKKVDMLADIKDWRLKKYMLSNDIPVNSPGVIFNSNAAETRKLWLTDKIQKYVKEHIKDLKENKEPILQDLEFLSDKDLDAYLALQHCKMYNPHITKDGYFEATIYDYYNYEHRDYKFDAKGLGKKTKDLVSTYLNNWGYTMQEKGLLENYFVIYKIREKIW